ncbi:MULTISPECIES: branched-chain amino acid ABC transporter substrate-binding protein [Leucobacter]|uniref:branched-chain amino acid ABC transporter substrate-binding protein n=1 Tax=Leucobacter TaxID=55968 RepID=UPI000E64BE48|nr:branched-chain amino acid ABC transporter substrate-binding protein [Leucobacter aridicollis]UTX53034.1 branched-chain amino acid ABC transporter substrate-binding protein [Leucobacter aridicollis]
MISRSHSRVRRLAAFGAIAASAALVLSGCSGGLAGGDSGGSSDGPIKLGMLAPFSGSEAAFGDYMKFGAQLAIDEINEDGGVDGRELELVTEDDGCDATAAVAAANKLVSAGVEGSVGGYCSGATLPTLPVFKEAGISMVIPAANSTKLVGQGAFLINGTGTQQGKAAVAYAEKLGAKSVVLIDDNTDYSVDLANAFEEQAGSLNIAKRESVNPDEKDFGANINSIIAANPDFIYWTGYYQAGGLLIDQLRAAGYDGTILVGDGSVDAQLAAIAGPAIENVFGTFTRTPDMLEGGDAWVKAYTELAKADPGPYSMQTYEAVKAIAQAMTDAGSTDAEAVDKALLGLKAFPLLSGDLTFAKDGSREGGGFVIVSPTGENGAFVLSDDLS